MDIQAEKIALAKLILNTDDELIIDQIKSLFENDDEASWDEVPEYVRQGVKESIAQADRGELISLEEVRKEVSLLLKSGVLPMN